MYSICRTKVFEKSFRKLSRSGKIYKDVRARLERGIDMLAEGRSLPEIHKEHGLKGELKKYRECHIKGDLLLVYQRNKKELILVLVDIGSHSQIFG